MRSFLWAAGGTLFAFAMTAVGAALVFFLKNRVSARVSRMVMGLSGGVMSAAAVFGLLLPAAEQMTPVAAVIGFLLGAGLMLVLDLLLGRTQALAFAGSDRRGALMISAVTLHNIPEGMAVGLAFALAAQGSAAALAGALALALGIGVQNVPEGAAVALPLYEGGMSRTRSFAWGALSGAAEPAAGLVAVALAASAAPVVPLLMTLSAGAMMWVVFAEMLPAAGAGRDGALAAALGYALMMALDLTLG